ncbi:MAG: adenylate/guanylate cyclase domain-containing protein [Alcanivoracaceae bacterium]|nr:adenylate/guanylate cyclase domain-containing protein [Alcanivoracaceae bacterium]
MPSGKLLRRGMVALVCAAFLAHSVHLIRLAFIDSLENAAYDVRLRLTAPGGIDDRVIIADIDEKSLAEIGHWPWNRGVLADLMNSLFDHYNVKTVGFDVVFAEPDTDQGVSAMRELASGSLKNNSSYQRAWKKIEKELDYDKQFSDSFVGHKVVTGFVFDQADPETLNDLPEPVGELPENLHGVLPLAQPPGYTGNLKVLQDTAWSGGFFDNPTLDSDGVFRRVPVIQEFNGKLYNSLAFGLLRAALDDPPIDLIMDNSGSYPFIDAIKVGDDEIPLAPLAAVLVPYRGKSYSFPYFSVSDIIEKRIDKSELEGRIVLLGTSAPGLKDQRTTPFESSYPGVEVHANLVAGMLDGNIKRQPGWVIAVEFFMLLLISITLGILNNRLEPMRSLIITVAVVAALLIFNMWAWNKNLVLPIVSPLLLTIIIFIIQSLWGFFAEARNKRQLATLFGQYIPPELVEEMAETPNKIDISGESRELTVLFSDVRGFTTISEGLDPHELTTLMNEMLTPMTHVIHEHRGTIDKYMGDAIMAFWGAPLADQQHARHALDAAMDMIKALPKINERFSERGWPEINIGVGLNTGNMSVGNMGSEFRMAYTVMGDAVNLGSRLESLTKQYGVNIIVSEFTRAAVPEYAYRELDRVRVKGKEEPVAIYQPIGPANELEAGTLTRLERFHEALELYRNQKWDEAEHEINQISRESDRYKIYNIYLERIATFRANPPGENWDGVFTHTSK